MKIPRSVVLLCILGPLAVSIAVLLRVVESAGLLPGLFVPALFLIYLQQGRMIRKAEEEIGIARMVGRTRQQVRSIAIWGAVLFLIPCAATFMASKTDAWGLFFLLCSWLLAMHLNWAPQRLSSLRAVLNYYHAKQTEAGQVVYASGFWYLHIAAFSYGYLMYMVLSALLTIRGEEPKKAAAIVVGTTFLLEMLFYGLVWGIPGWKASRAAKRAMQQSFA